MEIANCGTSVVRGRAAFAVVAAPSSASLESTAL